MDDYVDIPMACPSCFAAPDRPCQQERDGARPTSVYIMSKQRLCYDVSTITMPVFRPSFDYSGDCLCRGGEHQDGCRFRRLELGMLFPTSNLSPEDEAIFRQWFP